MLLLLRQPVWCQHGFVSTKESSKDATFLRAFSTFWQNKMSKALEGFQEDSGLVERLLATSDADDIVLLAASIATSGIGVPC